MEGEISSAADCKGPTTKHQKMKIWSHPRQEAECLTHNLQHPLPVIITYCSVLQPLLQSPNVILSGLGTLHSKGWGSSRLALLFAVRSGERQQGEMSWRGSSTLEVTTGSGFLNVRPNTAAASDLSSLVQFPV